MKNAIICLMLSTFSCLAQDAAKFSGKIINPNSDKITLTAGDFKKEIPVAKNGTFSAAFTAPEAVYQLYDGAEYTKVYLKNGYDLHMKLNTAEFDESIVFTGKGAAENNVLAADALATEKFSEQVTAEKDDSNPMAMAKIFSKFNAERNARMTAPGIDPGLKKAFDARVAADAEKQKEKRKAAETARETAIAKYQGNAAPDFKYENHKGGKTKLSDFSGKYVYIDTWATWCGPCRAEIPSLQKIEAQYQGKNIEFVSISIDEMKNHDKWKKFVDDKKLGGVQLMADKDWKSDFVMALGIRSIPRFILIAPDGKVIDADAKRPSDPALVAQLDELLK